MAIAWALLTVSSEPQIGTLKHQRAWAVGAAENKGWQLTRIMEGVASGKEGPRAIARELLLEIRATPAEARPEHVLMIRLDRVGRGSIVDSQIFVRDLLALGARVYTRDAGEIRLDSAMDELIAAVQMPSRATKTTFARRGARYTGAASPLASHQQIDHRMV
jgi:DNA invertase Pin-like site-specific DNA recombinase